MVSSERRPPPLLPEEEEEGDQFGRFCLKKGGLATAAAAGWRRVVLGVAEVVVVRRRRRVARVERVVKEGMILVFFFLAWLVEADDGTCVGCTRGNRCSSCRRRRMECTSSVPSDRDVISRVDDSTVTQSWEISNRVRETERCRVNKGIPVVRGMPYIFIPCTHTQSK